MEQIELFAIAVMLVPIIIASLLAAVIFGGILLSFISCMAIEPIRDRIAAAKLRRE